MTHPTDPEPLIPGTGPAETPDAPSSTSNEGPAPAVPESQPAQSWFTAAARETPESAAPSVPPAAPETPESSGPSVTPAAPQTAESAEPWFARAVPDTPQAARPWPAQSWPAQSWADPGSGAAPQSEAVSPTIPVPFTSTVPVAGTVPPVAAYPQVDAAPQGGAAEAFGPPLPADAGLLLPPPPMAPPPKRRRGLVGVVALIVVGLLVFLGGAGALGWELTRKATKAEQAAALQTEIASRWQRLPAGKIFPARISYKNVAGYPTTAIRVGIAPRASCQNALEPDAVQTFRSDGCSSVLRATYVDASGTLVVTVGIAVMPSDLGAFSAQQDIEAVDSGDTLRAMPTAGTIAGTFSDAQRGAAEAQFAGPYVFLYTAGHTDGMPGMAAGTGAELTGLGEAILSSLENLMTSHTPACTMKDIKC